ncbi:alpha/beta hydrolase [Paenibacillus polymyxa]|uniref:alpha/beta fold hydrolase n=1 Tax=Paenibacillus polymyxa TaxID=1406 RepID=UPI001F1190C0|nr:alpha/beta hydrolase [Paenibacillus polymyxa]MDN4080840.1 alpha/beta hydrolase [Paenibacillus polymyxa]MDN4106525.1 alpha/beta hydrolase [Paenibacillus polymyxa]MDN4116480.1 alpha/beta hydrolase [Paenibacillus polymyxa]UMR37975.1 alpha/beta hydrolase [Paenibacillus polymyxa]
MSTYQTVISDGFELKYTIRGNGKSILVIGSSVYYPRIFSDHLYKKFQFIFLDHRGFAKPTRALKPEDYTLDKVIKDIETARQCLHLDPFIILGHSGHAFMALEYAKQYPDYVEKVVLLNSAPTNSQERQRQSLSYFYETASPARKERFEKDIVLLEDDIKRDPDRRFVHMCIRMGAQSFYDYTYDAAHMWNDVHTNMPIIDYLWGEAFGKIDLIQSLGDVDKPMFIGLGRTDYLVAPVSLWDRVDDSYTNVKKVVFEHSGHNPMFEEPHYFDQTLTEWINENH